MHGRIPLFRKVIISETRVQTKKIPVHLQATEGHADLSKESQSGRGL
jgi:hypothetical protein